MSYSWCIERGIPVIKKRELDNFLYFILIVFIFDSWAIKLLRKKIHILKNTALYFYWHFYRKRFKQFLDIIIFYFETLAEVLYFSDQISITSIVVILTEL